TGKHHRQTRGKWGQDRGREGGQTPGKRCQSPFPVHRSSPFSVCPRISPTSKVDRKRWMSVSFDRMSSRMSKTGWALAVILELLSTAVPVPAHHAFGNEYDANKPVTLKGTVTMMQFLNPHSWLYINVKDSKGRIVSWGIEMGPPHELAVQGWTKNTIPVGT